jgi:hypothetical protein
MKKVGSIPGTSLIVALACALVAPAAARAQTPLAAAPAEPEPSAVAPAPPSAVAPPAPPAVAPPAPPAVASPASPAVAPPASPSTLAAGPPPAAPTAPARIPLRVALALEGASGVVTGPFRSGLVGLRLDGRFSDHVSLGAYAGVAGLKGKDGRVRAGIVLAVLEYALRAPGDTVRLPLRFSTGYLGANGPVARVSGGVSVAVGAHVDLVGTLASTVWITYNQNLLSADVALEVAYRF